MPRAAASTPWQRPIWPSSPLRRAQLSLALGDGSALGRDAEDQPARREAPRSARGSETDRTSVMAAGARPAHGTRPRCPRGGSSSPCPAIVVQRASWDQAVGDARTQPVAGLNGGNLPVVLAETTPRWQEASALGEHLAGLGQPQRPVTLAL